jgi:aminoglycoside phosphotransferase (APT) family kinase protein
MNSATTRELAAREIQRFAETFGGVVDESLLERTSRLCEQLGEIPSVIEHRDFGPWNLFLDDTRRITVLDWESSRVRGLPLLDLIYFITYMAFFVDGAMVTRKFEESYRNTLDSRTRMGALRQELVEQHREQLGLSTGAGRALRALCWIGHAESEFQAFSADAGGPPSEAALQKSVFARLWALEVTDLR